MCRLGAEATQIIRREVPHAKTLITGCAKPSFEPEEKNRVSLLGPIVDVLRS